MNKVIIRLKQFFVGQVWLIALLTPLALFAILGVMTYKSNHQKVFKKETRVLLSEVQLSSANLAAIIAKPLSDLMVMKVYFDDQSSEDNALLAALTSTELTVRGDINVILLNLPRRNRMLVLTCVSIGVGRRNQAVTG
ncbi:MAG: hypothetical protein ACKVOA_04280 [Methylophilaceae bacterium]